MAKCYIGIEIGGTKLQVVTGDESCTITEKLRFNIEKQQGAAGIRKQLESALLTVLSTNEPLALGVGFGGPVNRTTGRISHSFQIEGWSDFDLKDWLQSLVDIPVCIENDANAAALGEALQGAGRNYQQVFYITLGSGVGGGLVKDGNIYHGAIPGESEIGHIWLERDGSTMESRCSGWAVDKKVRKVIKSEPGGILARLADNIVEGEAKFLQPALEAGDIPARIILRETANDIAFGLSHVVHLFHPEVIILGGGLSLIGEPLRVLVEENLYGHITDVFLPGPPVLLSGLKENAVPAGALELARQEYLQSK